MKDQHKIKEVIELLKEAPSEKVRLELLELLFTPNELEQLIARFLIIKNLVKGQETQRDLSAKLKLSIAKITRGSNELKRRSLELRNYLGEYFS